LISGARFALGSETFLKWQQFIHPKPLKRI